MEDFIYNQLLDQLPKDSPFKICRLCVKETYGLLEIADITDFSVVYTNITNVQLPNGLGHPNLVCPECMRRLRLSSEFKEMTRSSSQFWQTYLEKNNFKDIIVPFGSQFPYIEIKSEPDESSNPIAIFLPCYLQTDNKDDIVTTIANDDNQTMNVSDSSGETPNNLIEMPCEGSKKREHNRRTKVRNVRPGFCEICFKDCKDYDRHQAGARHTLHFNCAHCGMGAKTKERLLKHLQTAHINYDPSHDGKPFCSICKHEYLSYELWRRHIKISHQPINKVICPVCKKIFDSPMRYHQHKHLHRERNMQCPQCPKKFLRANAFNIHLAVHKAEKPFMCEMCGFRSKHKNNIQRHILGVHANKKQKRYDNPKAHCSVCNENFSRFKPFQVHLNEKHAALADSMLTAYRAELKRTCRYCVKKFDSIEQLEAHNREYAERHRQRRENLKIYNQSRKNKANPTNARFGIRYTCHICKNSFNTQRVLDSHIANHSKEPRPFICDICQATYRRLNDLTLHTQRVHTGERPFGCDKCDYRCLTRPELNSHNRHRHKILKKLST